MLTEQVGKRRGTQRLSGWPRVTASKRLSCARTQAVRPLDGMVVPSMPAAFPAGGLAGPESPWADAYTGLPPAGGPGGGRKAPREKRPWRCPPWSVSPHPACCSSPDVAHVYRGANLASTGVGCGRCAPAAQPSALRTWVSGALWRRSVTRQRASSLICGSGCSLAGDFEKLSGNFSVLLIQSRV